MPGYGSWKEIYELEYFQIREEGYSVEKAVKPPKTDGERLPIYGDGNITPEIEEHFWREAYQTLWLLRDEGVRPDFRFSEPAGFPEILAQAGPVPALSSPSPAEYRERIKGAWFGRCAGVVLGKPLEMGWDRAKIKKFLEMEDAYPLNNWVPAKDSDGGFGTRGDCLPSTLGNVRYVQPDDDIHYTVCALLLAERNGLNFTTADAGFNMLENIPYYWCWTADRQAYYGLVNLRADMPINEQVAAIPLTVNPWRECMVGFLRADFWGYISPAAPRRGAEYMYRDASLNLVKNGIYGGLFVQGCISAALSENPSVENILLGGLSLIPENSRLAHAVRDVWKWYKADRDFTVTCDRIYEKYGHWYFAGAINNLAFVTLALLHGGLDYEKTITTAVMCGTDTDCNAGTCGSIVGAALGFSEIDPKWTAPLNDTVHTAVAGFGHGTISELAERTVRFYEAYVKGDSADRENS